MTTLLTLQERTSPNTKLLRREGFVPIGLMEKGKPTRMLQATAVAVRTALTHTTGARMMDVKVEGEPKTWSVMVKQVNQDQMTGKVITMTLAEVSKTEAMITDVPVTHSGSPVSVIDGIAVLGHPTTHIRLKAKGSELPASIDVDVSKMQVGDSISAGDIDLPKGVELVSSHDATLFAVQITRAHADDAAPTETAPAPAAE